MRPGIERVRAVLLRVPAVPYPARHRLSSVDDWYAWLPGRTRPVLSTYGYEPRHAAPEEDA